MPVSPADVNANEGYGLTTAQIVYRMPDHLDLLQGFLWQRYDTFPKFPLLASFIAFWEEKIDGPIHSVTVAHARLLRPTDLREMARQRH